MVYENKILRAFRQLGICLAVGCLGWPVSASGQTSDSLQRQTSSNAVERYLKSLGLDELVIEHLEIETSREVDRIVRRKMATRLISEYAQRMLSSRDLVGSEWQAKAELLLKTYPALSTHSIRIAILQSNYVHAESEFRQWWNSGRDESLGSELVEKWLSLTVGLETLNRQLNLEYEDQVALSQTSPENKDTQSRQLARLEGLLLHADYLLGWASYYLGILTPENRRKWILESDSHFRSFLQIDPSTTLTDVAPAWIDFSSDLNARALAGLAMCQRGLNHPEQSQYCFELIENHAIRQQTRDLRYVWDLNCRVYLFEVSAAQQLAQSMGEARHLSESGRTTFWMATLNSSVALKNHAPLVSQRLLRSGLTGLARQFDALRIIRFLDENKIRIEGKDFLSLWVGGYLAFDHAVSSAAPNKFDIAKTKLSAALACDDESANDHDVSRCRFLLGKIQLQERAYDLAAETFIECSNSLEKVAPELAAEAQWLAVRSLVEHSRTHWRSHVQANRAIDHLIRRFPGSTFAKQAEFEKLRHNTSHLPPETMIARLRKTPRNDSNYPAVVNEVVKIRFQAWLDSHQSNSVSESDAYLALIAANEEIQQLTSASDDMQLKSQLLVINAMLRTDSTDEETIRGRISDVTRRLGVTPNVTPVYQELRYYQFLLANRIKDQAQAKEEAQWLTSNAQGSQFEKSAMLQLAQLADQQFKKNTGSSQGELAELISIFSQLVGFLGSSESELKQQPNARVAYARLAALKLMSGANEEAIQMLESLNEFFPNHKSYLRQLATTYTQSKAYSQAISIWQKLVRGVEPGSDLWFESKYYLALSLYHNGDVEEARRLNEQTRRLSPVLPDDWIVQFDELTSLLEAN